MQFSANGTEYKSNEKGNYFYKKVEGHWKRIGKAEWDEARTTRAEVVITSNPTKRTVTSADILRLAWMEAEIMRRAIMVVVAILVWTVGILLDTLRDPAEDLIWWIIEAAVWTIRGADLLLDFLLEVKARIEPGYMM